MTIKKQKLSGGRSELQVGKRNKAALGAAPPNQSASGFITLGLYFQTLPLWGELGKSYQSFSHAQQQERKSEVGHHLQRSPSLSTKVIVQFIIVSKTIQRKCHAGPKVIAPLDKGGVQNKYFGSATHHLQEKGEVQSHS